MHLAEKAVDLYGILDVLQRKRGNAGITEIFVKKLKFDSIEYHDIQATEHGSDSQAVVPEGEATTIYEHKYWKGSFLTSNPISHLEKIQVGPSDWFHLLRYMRINQPDIFKHAMWYKKTNDESNNSKSKDTKTDDGASSFIVELWCNEVCLNFWIIQVIKNIAVVKKYLGF